MNFNQIQLTITTKSPVKYDAVNFHILQHAFMQRSFWQNYYHFLFWYFDLEYAFTEILPSPTKNVFDTLGTAYVALF